MDKQLTEYLGLRYAYTDWAPAFRAIDAETDAIEILTSKPLNTEPVSPSWPCPAPLQPSLPQLKQLKTDLMDVVEDLHIQKRVCGTAPTFEDLLNLIKSAKGETEYKFPGGDAEIIVSVNGGEESEEEDGEEEEVVKEVTKWQEVLVICTCMEQLCIEYSEAACGVSVLGLQGQLQKLRCHFHCLKDQSCIQTTLPALWSQPSQSTTEDIVMS